MNSEWVSSVRFRDVPPLPKGGKVLGGRAERTIVPGKGVKETYIKSTLFGMFLIFK